MELPFPNIFLSLLQLDKSDHSELCSDHICTATDETQSGKREVSQPLQRCLSSLSKTLSMSSHNPEITKTLVRPGFTANVLD